jgi:psiF repeat
MTEVGMDSRFALQPFLVALAIAFALPVMSPEPAAAQQQATPQQQRMKDCNAIAGRRNLAGDARKDFMSECLSGSSSGATGNSQQDKMKACNAKASDQKLTGDVRQRYMSNCLKG